MQKIASEKTATSHGFFLMDSATQIPEPFMNRPLVPGWLSYPLPRPLSPLSTRWALYDSGKHEKAHQFVRWASVFPNCSLFGYVSDSLSQSEQCCFYLRFQQGGVSSIEIKTSF